MNWVQAERSAASARLRDIPAPHSKDEGYRFTGIDAVEVSAQEGKEGSPAPEVIDWNPSADSALCLATASSQSCQSQQDALIFSSWDKLSAPQISRVERLLGEKNNFHQDYFAALASSKAELGFVLVVPKGVAVELPARFAFWMNRRFAAYRNLIVLEEGSRLDFVEELYGDKQNEESTLVGLAEFYLGANSRLNFSQVQGLSASCRVYLRQRFVLESGAQLNVSPLHFGGAKGQLRSEVILQGKDAQAQTMGAVKLHGQQHLDFWSETLHKSCHTNSHLNFFFVLDEESKAVFNGTISIPPTSPHCEATQRHRTLLLGDKATVYTMPKLEIAVDEVKCAHGASVSSLQDEQLYYLRTRGISQSQAERMIINGFLEPVLGAFPASLKERVTERMGERLGLLLN